MIAKQKNGGGMQENFPKRKSPRLKDYDYSTNGIYFITVCTESKKCTLANIVGEGFPLPQNATVKLTVLGEIVEKAIQKIPEKYPEIYVERYVIMPNHFHILLLVSDFPEKEDYGRGDPSPTKGSIVAALGWLKYTVSKHYNKLCGTPARRHFQRSFHDHIVRNEIALHEIERYIENNPIRWREDCFYQK